MTLERDRDEFLAAAHANKPIWWDRDNAWNDQIVEERAKTKEQCIAERAKKSPNLLCFIEQFPLAMAAIAECHDYERGPLAKGDYRPSLLRHLFGIVETGQDDETPLLHKKKVAWNAIADLEITLRQNQCQKKNTGP